MKCVAISDTHGMYDSLVLPEGDVLIHAGDILGQGTLAELGDFNHWLARQPFKHKVVIAGNHDWCFQHETNACREILTHAHYLQDEVLEIDGRLFYGSPWQPEFFNWAFNLPRGSALKEKWCMIPDTLDVLITHGPPVGILDQTRTGLSVGCEELLLALDRIDTKYHVFGHIHEAYGRLVRSGCTFINASTNNAQFKPINPPMVFDV